MSMEQPLIIAVKNGTIAYPDQYPTAADYIKRVMPSLPKTTRVIAILSKVDRDLLMADLLINDLPTDLIQYYTIDQFSILVRSSKDWTVVLISRDYLKETGEGNAIRVAQTKKKDIVYIFKNRLSRSVSDAVHLV